MNQVVNVTDSREVPDDVASAWATVLLDLWEKQSHADDRNKPSDAVADDADRCMAAESGESHDG